MTPWSIGDALLIDGQRFDCIGRTVAHSKRTGRDVSLVVLKTLCPDCGAPFEVRSTEDAAMARKIARRCAACRNQRRRVRCVLHLPADVLANGEAPIERVLRSAKKDTGAEACEMFLTKSMT